MSTRCTDNSQYVMHSVHLHQALFASRCLSCATTQWRFLYQRKTFYSRAVLRNCNKRVLCSFCCYLGSLRMSRQIFLIKQQKMWFGWPLSFNLHTSDSETIHIFWLYNFFWSWGEGLHCFVNIIFIFIISYNLLIFNVTNVKVILYKYEVWN